MSNRIERDPLGEVHVPADAYYGGQTARAVENFPISGLRAPADLVTATLLVSMKAFRTRCVDGIAANEDRARELLDRSTAMATALSPYIGYAATAEVAKESVKTGRSLRDLVLARGLLDQARLDRILSPGAMTRGGIVGGKE